MPSAISPEALQSLFTDFCQQHGVPINAAKNLVATVIRGEAAAQIQEAAEKDRLTGVEMCFAGRPESEMIEHELVARKARAAVGQFARSLASKVDAILPAQDLSTSFIPQPEQPPLLSIVETRSSSFQEVA